MSFSITSGAKTKAQKVCVYGVEGIGKTTFAAQFPSPVFIDTEGSTEFLDVKRFETPQSWNMLLEEVRYVRDNPSLCATLVIDTLDWAERICIASVCAKQGINGIEDMSYGRGYTYAYEEFGKLLNALSDVAEHGVNVVCVAHAMIKKFEQPDEVEPYDRYQLKLVDTPKKSNAGMVKEWADAVLFANYKTIVETVGDGKGAKGKARGGQKRVMHCQHHACWDAKNRWGLPEEVPFDYAQIAQFIPTQIAAAPIQAPTPQQAVPHTDPSHMHAQQVPAHAPQPALSPQAPQAVAHPAAPQAAKGGVDPFWGAAGKPTDMPDKPASAPSLPAYFAPLLQLMESNHVTVDEVRDVVAKKGHFTRDTPFENYPQDYVEGVLIGAWPMVLEAVKNDVPFN